MFERELLVGRTILVTGGGTGLGKAMALRFAELGAQVAVLGRRQQPLEQVVAEISSAGGKAAWVSADVRDRSSVDAALDRLEAELLATFDARQRQRIPLGRYGEPRELADLAVYLTAAPFVTGECVTIDGGEWLEVGQEFASITDHPREQVKQVLAGMRARTHKG